MENKKSHYDKAKVLCDTFTRMFEWSMRVMTSGWMTECCHFWTPDADFCDHFLRNQFLNSFLFCSSFINCLPLLWLYLGSFVWLDELIIQIYRHIDWPTVNINTMVPHAWRFPTMIQPVYSAVFGSVTSWKNAQMRVSLANTEESRELPSPTVPGICDYLGGTQPLNPSHSRRYHLECFVLVLVQWWYTDRSALFELLENLSWI